MELTAKNLLTQLVSSDAPVHTNALALVQVALRVAGADALGVARVDETVEHISDHIELSADTHLDCRRLDLRRRGRCGRLAAAEQGHGGRLEII